MFDEALELSCFQTVVSVRGREWAVGGRVKRGQSGYANAIYHFEMGMAKGLRRLRE